MVGAKEAASGGLPDKYMRKQCMFDVGWRLLGTLRSSTLRVYRTSRVRTDGRTLAWLPAGFGSRGRLPTVAAGSGSLDGRRSRLPIPRLRALLLGFFQRLQPRLRLQAFLQALLCPFQV